MCNTHVQHEICVSDCTLYFGALLFSHAVNTLFVVEAKILKDPPPAHAKVLLLKSIQNATKCSNILSSWLPHLINMDLKDGTSLGCVPIRRMIVTAVNHGGRVFSQDIHSQLLRMGGGRPNPNL